MNFKVTVIIPIFNAEDDLKIAINSLLNQTIGFSNIELILVDDNSTDNSKHIIEDYEKNYDNAKAIFCDKNSGFPGKPRNIGIEHASTEYIIFLDSDDVYVENAIEKLYNTIINEKSDFVVASNYINLNGDQVKANIFNSNENLVNFNPNANQENFDIFSSNFLIGPWGKIFNKELLINNNIRFLEDSLCEDTYFYFKTLINSNKVTILPNDYLYVYNTFEDKQTAIHGHDLKKFNNFLTGFRRTKELLNNINFSINVFLAENISSLLLIFSNLNKSDKNKAIIKIYEFEKGLNIKIPKKEIAVLNNLIIKKHFKIAIILSNFYSFLYNNVFIKNIYRKINNKKNS